jgi:hypothetical protein
MVSSFRIPLVSLHLDRVVCLASSPSTCASSSFFSSFYSRLDAPLPFLSFYSIPNRTFP